MDDLVLGIGSNKGDREQWLKYCHTEISSRIGMIERFSPIIESEPWGYDSDSWFLNQILIVKTDMNVHDILRIIQQIEAESGRIHTDTYSDRNVDIDILFLKGDVIREEKLIIPHEHLHERLFVLVPLAEILPDFIHPVTGKSITELLADCIDNSDYHWFS